MIIRSKTFRQWVLTNFDKDELEDLSRCGASGGFPYLMYHKDTRKLYDKFKNDIWGYLAEDTDMYGNGNIFEMMSNFGGAKNVDGCAQFEHLLVWYAAERVAHEVSNQ